MGVTSHVRRPDAFTLIELLVVILIIGILIAVAAPSFLGQTQKAHDSAAKQALSTAYRAAKASTVREQNQGSYVVQDVVNAINDEGSLSATQGQCPLGVTSTNPRDIVVDQDETAGGDLKICNDPVQRVWTLTVDDHGPPTFSLCLKENNVCGGGAAPPAPTAWSDYVATVQIDNPTSWWHLGETSGLTAVDDPGANDGTYTAGTTLGAPGFVSGDSAISFPAANQTVSVPAAAAFVPDGPYSVELWVKPPAGGFSGYTALVNNQTASGGFVLTTNSDGQRLLLQHGDGSGANEGTTISNETLVAGQWNHVVGTFSGGTGSTALRLYLNGAETTYQLRSGGTGPLAGATTALQFAAANLAGASLDEVAFYDGTVLSPTRVSAHYNARNVGPPVNSSLPTVSGLARPGETLTASSGTWAGTEPFSYSYTWQRSSDGTSWSDSGSGQTRALTSADLGFRFRVVVIATNSRGVATATSTASPLVSTGPSANDYAATVLADSPYLYWRFSETTGTSADDATANNRDGVYAGGTTLGVSGPFAGDVAASFDGNDDRVSSTLPTLNTSPVTVEAFVYLTAYPAANAMIAGFVSGWGGGIYDKDLFVTPEGKLIFYGHNGVTGVTTTTPASPIPLNQWVHVAGVFDGSQVRAYQDGVQVGAAAQSATYTSYPAGTPNIFVGGKTAAYGSLSGRVDEVAVYTTGLSASRILDHYQTFNPSAPTNSAAPTITGGAFIGSTLTAQKGTWSGGGLSYSYQWQASPDSSSWTNAGSGQTRAVTAADEGKHFRVLVTASNIQGALTVSSATVGPVSASASYTALVDQTSGLQAYWRFNEASGTTSADSAGSRTATWAVAPTWGVTGAIAGDANKAVALNGTQHATAPTLSLNRYTVELWFKPSGGQGAAGQVPAIVSTTFPSTVNYMLAFTGGTRSLRGGTFDGAWRETGSVTLADNAWSYIVLTYDGSFIRLYVNGIEAATAVAYSGNPTSSGSVQIGKRWDYDERPNGALDELAIYNRALTPSEISQHYAAAQ